MTGPASWTPRPESAADVYARMSATDPNMHLLRAVIDGLDPVAVVTDETDWMDEFLGPDCTPPADVVIDLDGRVQYVEAATSLRARRVQDRAVKSSVKDLRTRGLAGAHSAYARLLTAGARAVSIDAEERTRREATT